MGLHISAIQLAVGLLVATAVCTGTSAESSTRVVQPYAADEARLPTATELEASANAAQGAVSVALLQLSLTPAGSNISAALDTALATAVAQGADLAVTPAAWIAAPLTQAAVVAIASPLAVQHDIAVGIAFDSSTESCLLLLDRTGDVLAQHSKPLDSATAPLVSDGVPPTVLLATQRGVNVSVGLLLGHEILYPELPR